MREFEFVAINSGDGEYIPDTNSPLRLYPNDLFGDSGRKVRIKLILEDVYTK
ncbi:hypothetical protein [Bacillus sp. TL12]|uniref:hypothetical protein n=1 Tax=Bacillus sp. TL12 TaxID=2894756 RepID=UPI001F51B6CF|nr:hypothetical protein [Bacillus sp. TL12]MCI0768483.1 hypothetical protein [Bacillus sp. TL12]